MKAKRSPVEVWRQLVDEAGEDEIERAASVSVEQAEKELTAAGFDVAAERAKAEALLRELESGGRIGRQNEKAASIARAETTPSSRQRGWGRRRRRRS